MSITHHPEDATLMEFAAGTLSEPFGIIVAAHQIEGNSPVRLVLEAMFDDMARQLRLGPLSAR